MGEPIRLNVDKVFDSVKGAITGIHHSVEVKVVFITDDHIRAIHARMLAMGLFDDVYDHVHDFNAVGEHGVTTRSYLINRHATPAPASPVDLFRTTGVNEGIYPACITNPHDMAPSQWASAAASAGAKPVEFDKPASPVDDDLSSEAVAAIERGCEDSRQGRVTEMDFSEHASPVDDEATIKAMADVTLGWVPTAICRGIVAAIRSGDVPGLTTTDQLAAAHVARDASAQGYRDTIKEIAAERDTLKAEVERLRTEAEARVSGNQKVRQGLIADIRKVKAERDAAIARAEAAEVLLESVWNSSNYEDLGSLHDFIGAHLAKHGGGK